MNRQQRRKLQRASKREAGSDPVMLKSGPMDGWYVPPEAPALKPDWRTDGRYERTGQDIDGIEVAEWQPTA